MADDIRKKQIAELAKRGREKREADVRNDSHAGREGFQVAERINRFQSHVENKIPSAFTAESASDMQVPDKASFKENFKNHFLRRAGMRLGGHRSDGKTLINNEYVLKMRELLPADKQAELAGLASFIKESRINLQLLINEKGYYTGPAGLETSLER